MKHALASIIVAFAVLTLGAPLPSVLAEANGAASCVGIESAAISPPGSSDEEPGGRAQVAHELKGASGELGVPPGALINGFARLHAGSHEECDEALAE